tara:strand:+ start:903 stop:1613 length:711 start_codon:yes stop_codon:yes gene_type:complete
MKHGKFSESDKIVVEEDNSVTIDDSTESSNGSDTYSQSAGGSSVSPNSSEEVDSSPPPADTHEWMTFDFGSDDESTDTIPSTFKSVMTPVPQGSGKLSKAQAKALENQNKGILKMALTFTDVILTKYAQAVTLDPDMTVSHSESDKELVANAQYRWMEEKGFFLTNYLSTGMIAGSLSVWYVGSPLLRIRKKAKKRFFKGRGLLARLPLIGRLFRRKQEVAEVGQNVEEVSIRETR